MKVIIIGAGDVGFVAAETICDGNEVLVVERDQTVANTLKSRLNVAVLEEDGTNPRSLEYAMTTHGADVLISTLHSDSDNLFVCMMAKRLDPKVRTVATVDNPDYIIATSAEGAEGVDVIISPDLVIAEKMYMLCVLENAVEFEAVEGVDACFAAFKVERGHQVVGKVVMHLSVPEGCTVFAIDRDGETITEPETVEIHVGDRICVFGSREAVRSFNGIMGVESVAREICILGGSVIGLNLAKMLLKDREKRYVKVIDDDAGNCAVLNRVLNGVSIIDADYTDPDVQRVENVFKADATVSTSRKDDTNLLVCMSSKMHDARKVIARFFMREYEEIFKFTELQTIIGYDRVVSNEIAKSLVTQPGTVPRLQTSNGVFFSHAVDSESRMRGRYVGDLNPPEGLRFVAILRDGALTYPRLDTEVLEGDSIVMFSTFHRQSELERILGKIIAMRQ